MLRWFKKKPSAQKKYCTNEDWVEGLRAPAERQAITQLRDILVHDLKPALAQYVDHELNQFVEDTVQDALLKILDHVETFRGESKFTTWAMKIAVREGFTELRRKRYDDISIEDLKPDGPSEQSSPLFAGNQPAPDRATHQHMLLEKTQKIIDNELTKKQQTVITALMIHDLPIGVVADQLGTNRNALYKMVYDTRRKLKDRFSVEGIDPDDILNKM